MLERLRVGPLGENAYALASEGTCILVDPGDEAPRILAFLDSRGLAPSLIVATHGHLDHVAAVPELLAAWRGRGMKVGLAVHADDAGYFGPEAEDKHRRLFAAIRALGYFEAFWRPLPPPDLILQDGDAVPGSPYRVIHTPGHTRGSICLYDEAAGLLISGDTLFRGGYGRTDGPDSDPAALEESLARLGSLPPETRVYPGHGEETAIGREAR
jgi:hydroxyacylglutathione hydrolase